MVNKSYRNLHANYALFLQSNPLIYLQNAVEGKNIIFAFIRIDWEKYRII
jgi:hypothetical protein